MTKPIVSALINGVLSGLLYIVVFGTGLGFIFMFLPSLPLFFVSLSARRRITPLAVITAAALVAMLVGSASGTVFLLFIGLPAWYFSRTALLRQSGGNGAAGEEWFPVGLIIQSLALYATCLLALLTLYYYSTPGGLPHILAENIREAFAELGSEYGDIIERMAGTWAFMMFPITIWLWGLLIYAHAWIANRLLARFGQNIRPDMAVRVFAVPGWMLSLLAICALATLIGGTSMSFLGKAGLLTLMLPYFFLGCSLMHRACATWPNNRFLLFIVYFLAFSQFWPAVILAAVGLWHQVSHLQQPRA